VYSNHQWKKWRFNRCPRGFWANINNQKECFDGIGRELGVEVLEDWYRIHSKQVAAQGGSSKARWARPTRKKVRGKKKKNLFRVCFDGLNCTGGGLLDGYYNFSLTKALKTIYPDHTWESHRFVR
jgi:hypothetical protein